MLINYDFKTIMDVPYVNNDEMCDEIGWDDEDVRDYQE